MHEDGLVTFRRSFHGGVKQLAGSLCGAGSTTKVVTALVRHDPALLQLADGHQAPKHLESLRQGCAMPAWKQVARC